MTGSHLATSGVVQDRTRGTHALLEAWGVVKSYQRGWRRKPNHVLLDAGIELHPGEIVGLVGENGSGKSTFMKILSARSIATVEMFVAPGLSDTAPRSHSSTSDSPVMSTSSYSGRRTGWIRG